MKYVITNPFCGDVVIDLPFTDIQGAKRQFQDLEQKQRVYASCFAYQALVTSAKCLHTVLAKSERLEEEKHTLRLPGMVTSEVNVLDYLNREGEKAQGENRHKYNIIAQAKQANKAKLEKSEKEIQSILSSINYTMRKYEYLYSVQDKGFYPIDVYTMLYIDKRLASCTQDTNDIVSDTKTALYTIALQDTSADYTEVEHQASRALWRYIYDFKKTDVHYCLDDENQTLSINRMLQAMEINGASDKELRKAINGAMKYLSKPERTVALCIGYGYTLEYAGALLDKSLTTTFRLWEKAKGKLAMLIPSGAMKAHIKPIVLAQARNELQAIQEQEKEQEKEKNRARQKAHREKQKALATDEEKALAKEKNRARQKAYRERQKALAMG